MMGPRVPQPHDLVLLSSEWWIDQSQDWPEWLMGLMAAGTWVPFAVVRRAGAPSGQVAIGIRGFTRGQRFATYVPEAAIVSVLTPRSIVTRALWRQLAGSARHQTIKGALIQLASDLAPFDWGIGGSVGYELLTQTAVIHAHSDLDLVIERTQPLTVHSAAKLLAQCGQLGVAVDVQIQNSHGAFHLQEYVHNAGRPILLKTAYGPVLSDDLWPLAGDA